MTYVEVLPCHQGLLPKTGKEPTSGHWLQNPGNLLANQSGLPVDLRIPGMYVKQKHVFSKLFNYIPVIVLGICVVLVWSFFWEKVTTTKIRTSKSNQKEHQKSVSF